MAAPSLVHLLSMTATLVPRTETVTAGGDIDVTEDAGAPVPCYLERQTVTEQRDGENVTIALWRGYFDSSFSAKAGDVLVSPEGLRLELVGAPEAIWNPRTGTLDHLEVRMREQT